MDAKGHGFLNTIIMQAVYFKFRFSLSYRGDEVQITNLVQLMARGTIRRKICSLPPICLNISDSGIKTDSLQDGIQLNMVLPCKSADQYGPYVLSESWFIDRKIAPTCR